MVVDELKNILKNTIKEYGIDDIKTYHLSKILSIENDKKYTKKSLQNYYLNSLIALIEYMKINEKNPSESIWNKYAIENKCLSSKTIGYMYENGFNNLCRKIRKDINKRFLL